MLKTSKLVNNASVNRLVKLWTQRYTLDFSVLCSQKSNLTVSQLVEVTSTEGRAKTVATLKRLLQVNCECAAIKTDTLFSYIPNVVNLTESERIAHRVGQIYTKALEIYEQQSPLPVSLKAIQSSFVKDADFSSDIFTQWTLLEIQQLASALEPLIQKLQEQHLLAKNDRAIGFLTTQLHFSTQLILKSLTLPEQVFIRPYFSFIEEQVCIPWQRVCCAAGNHPLGSPTLAVVEQLLRSSHEIASTVYHRAAQLYPDTRSLRGGLLHPGVMASTTRDLQMFQSYLCLCVLEKSMAAMEQELLPLCVLVFPSIEVTWKLVGQMLQLLVDELMVRVQPSQMLLLLPYTQAMQELFSNLDTESG